jgi:hypothetical protein
VDVAKYKTLAGNQVGRYFIENKIVEKNTIKRFFSIDFHLKYNRLNRLEIQILDE